MGRRAKMKRRTKEPGTIHPTAIVHPKAEVGKDVAIGPYCVIGEHVKIGRGVKLMSHVAVEGWTEIGEDCQFFPFSSIGTIPQDLKFQGEKSRPRLWKQKCIW